MDEQPKARDFILQSIQSNRRLRTRPARGFSVQSVKSNRRIRTRPVRKWKNSETINLITFLIHNRNFESPSQRTYYEEFINQYAIDIPWDLVRRKVRNLRLRYEHLRNLFKPNDHGVISDRDMAGIRRSCPFFEKLAIVFEHHATKNDISFKTDDSMSQSHTGNDQHAIAKTSMHSADNIKSFAALKTPFFGFPNPETSAIAKHQSTYMLTESSFKPIQLKEETFSDTDITVETEQITDQHDIVIPLDSANDRNMFNIEKDTNDQNRISTGTAQIPAYQPCNFKTAQNWSTSIPKPAEKPQHEDLEMLKFQFEKEKFLRRMLLKEKKLEFKLELEKMKIDKELSLLKLQLESDERIAMKTLEMKQCKTD